MMRLRNPAIQAWPVLLIMLVSVACNFPGLRQAAALTPPAAVASPAPTEPSTRAPTTPAPAPAPTLAYQPVFEPAGCAFPIPQGTNPECGYLVVPENRARPDSPTIRLHVAVFHSTAAQRAPDPVVHLAGGPGSSSLEEAGYLFSYGLGAVQEQRDLILFDQRGTGYSLPRLDCPERQALTPQLLDGSLSPEQAEIAMVQAFQQCHDRLVAEGIDLSAYNSAASAADVEDLRRALGSPALNLYGVSYGTRLALTVLRDHRQAVRSAVLDSVYPPQVNLYTALASNAERAFNRFFDNCAVNPSCNTYYPDLRATFYQLVDDLNAHPLKVQLQAGGAQRTVRLDGGRLIDVLLVGLYNPQVTAAMPQMIFDIRNGDYSILKRRLALYFDTSTALGMQMAVQCAEEIPFNTPDDAVAAAHGVQPQIAAFFPASVRPLFAACRAWRSQPPDPRENQPVRSDVPALVLAGELDPITPPAWGQMAAGDLPRAQFFEFPGQGHWVTRSSGCALQMALDFWRDPQSIPDSSCK